MKKKGEKKFGFARAFVIFWLGILGIGYMTLHPLIGILMILALLYVVGMDPINERLARKKKEEDDLALVKYDPAEHGEPMTCPYCGKEVPSEHNYCFYCGRSLADYKRIEAVRTASLESIDESLEGIGKGVHRDNILMVRDYTDKILRKYETEPENPESYEKFIEYYLPKTVSAIGHYHTLCSLNNLDAEEQRIKKQFEDSLALMAEAFENIFNRVSTEGLLDISTDVSALENILKQDGLTDSDFPAAAVQSSGKQ